MNSGMTSTHQTDAAASNHAFAPSRAASLWRQASWRAWLLILVLAVMLAVLFGRFVYLHLLAADFLTEQSNQRIVRTQPIQAHRGKILDRHGEPLAISSPVASLWINPRVYWSEPKDLQAFCKAAQINCQAFKQRLKRYAQREFLYVKRQLPPKEAKTLMDFKLPGLELQNEYKRFYPAAEVGAHIVGFTDINDQGQEGLELAYDQALTGVNGQQRVMRDRLGRIVKNLAVTKEVQPGQELKLTLDLNLQYLAYLALKEAVDTFQAASGSLVLADAINGDILALVNQPAYNPNNQQERVGAQLRNRAFTDVFEPGSTMKALTVATALESGQYHPHSRVNTHPGYMDFGGYRIRDPRNYGVIDLTTLMTKSSNIGSVKLAFALGADVLWQTFHRLGLGVGTASGFPGEVSGWLPDPIGLRPSELATLSYGYGLAVTPVQLTQAYLALASGGVVHPLTLVLNQPRLASERVFSPKTAWHVRKMLSQVVTESGTGARARVPGYDVAGKTGTSRIVGKSGYDVNRHVSFFAGMAPVKQPAFVMTVIIRDPKGDQYSGGKVAAPVFSKVMQVALRNASIPPTTQYGMNRSR